jgi:hypothetical protein
MVSTPIKIAAYFLAFFVVLGLGFIVSFSFVSCYFVGLNRGVIF